jgi:DNA invertase Pin-like site-specific DNA recombinase
MLVGYAHVLTLDQNSTLPIIGLKAAGCERLFTEKASAAQRERPELQAVLQLRVQLKCSPITRCSYGGRNLI